MDAYLRYPHVHGDEIVAVADNDLWLVPVAGGRASRLTSDHEPCMSPLFSPDGSRVAWASVRNGAPEVFVLDRDAGTATRLTWWGRPGTRVAGWVDDDHVLVASDHGEPHVQRRRLFSVGLDGAAERLPYGLAMSLATGPHGDAIVTPNGRDHAMWKRYRGGTAAQLWLRPDGSGEWQRVLADEEAGFYSPIWVGDRLAFTGDLGARFPDAADEQGQLWSVDARGSDLRQHTHHTPAQGYVRDATTDGTRVVYHAHGNLYVLESLDSEPRRVEVDLGPSPAPRATITASDGLHTVVPDESATGSLVRWHGQVWWLTHRGGPARRLVGDDATHIRASHIGGQVVVAAVDHAGVDRLIVADPRTDEEPRVLDVGDLGIVLHVRVSPTGRRAAVASHDGEIRIVDLTDGTARLLPRSRFGEPLDLRFSPDGRHLVWSEPVRLEGNHRLMHVDLDDPGEARPLTSGRFDDRSPAFTRDGRHLAFLSARTLDPSYSQIGFDLSFANAQRPWLAPLQDDQPAPFGPARDGRPVSVSDSSSGEDAESDEAVAPARFDVDGFEDRLVPFPVASGAFDHLDAAKHGILWIRRTPQGELGAGIDGVEDTPRDVLERFDLRRHTLTELCDVDGYEVSGDGERLVIRDGDRVVVTSATSKADPDGDDHTEVDTGRLRRDVDLRAQWRAMFDDNHRVMAAQYWRADMDGVDWVAVGERYRPLIDRIRTRDDLVDVLWETVGELNTSHAYVTPPRGEVPGAIGFLGIDHERTDEGDIRITRILPGESSDPKARSPLRAAGVGAREGDLIVAVDGRSVRGEPLGRLLSGRVGQVVELTLSRDGVRRRVAVVPVADEYPLRYQEWVARCAAYVAERSGGRVGYLHVPDMVSAGWAQFHRGLSEAMGADAVLADVRYNRGGHTSQLVIERLSRRVLAWDEVRHIDASGTYPLQARRGPIVFLANRWSGSDGDIVNAAAQSLQLGPVIGERTWGGVVGIDGRFDLVDGTSVTQPRYAFCFEKHGWGVENHGVDPDIPVVWGPGQAEDELVHDTQLDRAVTELLAAMDADEPLTAPHPPEPRVRR